MTTEVTAPRPPIIAVFSATITIRGVGSVPTIAELETAIETAVTELGGTSKANQPLTTVNVNATRTDK